MEQLRILHTNDLHSHFEHFPKIGRYLKKAQRLLLPPVYGSHGVYIAL